MLLKIRALLSGAATYIPGYRAMRATGGTDSARYCYTVWLRHLTLANAGAPHLQVPHTVAELGPGDSIGIGVAALLSGAEQYYAFDVVAYPDLRRNLSIFGELVELFRRREPIPAEGEFAALQPRVPDTCFPAALLDEQRMRAALDPGRIAAIRASLENPAVPGSRIVYRAPWTDDARIESASVDHIFSQAVLEHVVDLPTVYGAMRRWLKPAGVMTHQIDYRCHGKADNWNGHWSYSDLAWRIVVGRRPYLLNRLPHSAQMALLRVGGFELVRETRELDASGITRASLAQRFREMSEDDLVTCGAFVLAAPAP
ncbi:MAG TPA: methyltransferase domain-containing protein [Steroidobacteraceae bacterium]|nr:methyltransferase domain-containing protein [Steroidobacteraceae bacterium]